MQNVNRQAEQWYDADSHHNRNGNLVTRLWIDGRQSLQEFRKNIGVKSFIFDTQRNWLGDLSGKRVLEIGCASGNSMSLYLASQAESYLGIDLSPTMIETLQGKLDERKLTNAHAEAIDFLSEGFAPEPFEVVYANSVVHHFRDMALFLSLLRRRLTPNGRVVTLDPMDTSTIAWSIRRPLLRVLTDGAWNRPFTRRTFERIQHHFTIEKVQGVLGASKWALPLTVVPGMRRMAVQMGCRRHERDRLRADVLGKDLWKCLSVMLCLRPLSESDLHRDQPSNKTD